MIIEYIAGFAVELKEPFDLSFISGFGEVFKVIDNWPGSGNLCFGAVKNGKKYFVKFAGAPKAKFDFKTPADAVTWLREAEQVYKDIRHDNLIKFVRGVEAGGGYALVFEWTDAECVGLSFPETRDKFLSLPIKKKLACFDSVLDFHALVAEKGYVAIDFYHDQMLYDFTNDKLIICDIDFYQKSPYYGEKGLWGSANFVSPEECEPGARMDETTMVYTMGASAFSIFADHDRSREKWPLSAESYGVIKKAVSDERRLRQRTIKDFIKEWNVCVR